MTSLFEFFPQWDSSLFFVDRWSTIFIWLIMGIGGLIAIYAWQYFDSSKSRIKFYSAFFPFLIAMLGVVLSSQLIHLYIAWELTTILSFFLVSFKGDSSDARRGAMHSILITGAGGLCLLAAILLLGSQDIWTLQALNQIPLAELPNGDLIGVLILLAAITKSAQFPFHFWLPGAMSAPTPASAFLHSATMVKAGIYLLFRLSPTLGSLEWFSETLTFIGLTTFFIGSVSSIFQMDLKAVLAGTTLSNLGLMVGLIGGTFEGSDNALIALVIAHALYKAGLFLFAGIVEHIAMTRDLSRISGLGKVFPGTQMLGLILAGASLGLPFTMGYYAKSLIHLPFVWKMALLAGFTLLGKAGILVAVRPFRGRLAGSPAAHATKLPSKRLLLVSPIVLGGLSWILPFLSHHWAPYLELPLSDVVPEISFILILSLVTAVAATYFSLMWRPSWVEWWAASPFPTFSHLFDEFWFGHLKFATLLTRIIQNGFLPFYLISIFGAFCLGLLFFWQVPMGQDNFGSGLAYILIFLAIGKVLGTILVVNSKVPIHSVIFVGLVGYSLALTFALLGAPDLALTQFAVETLTVLLLVFALRGTPNFSSVSQTRRLAKGIFATACGLVVGASVYTAALAPAPSRVKDFFSEASWLEAHGRNVVNVILVDFRGLDTMGEVVVLALAGFGVYLLVRGRVPL